MVSDIFLMHTCIKKHKLSRFTFRSKKGKNQQVKPVYVRQLMTSSTSVLPPKKSSYWYLMISFPSTLSKIEDLFLEVPKYQQFTQSGLICMSCSVGNKRARKQRLECDISLQITSLKGMSGSLT